MSKNITDLELVLQHQIAEHRKMLAMCDAHQAAMKKFDLKAMEDLTNLQEACRLRMATLEYKRKTLTLAIARLHKLPGDLKLTQLAELYPAYKPSLMKYRDELRGLIDQVSRNNFIAGKLAGAVLGHLNTVVRLLAGVVEKAGLYTKQGVPKVSARIGVMEAVG